MLTNFTGHLIKRSSWKSSLSPFLGRVEQEAAVSSSVTKATQGPFQGHGTELNKSISHLVNPGSLKTGTHSYSAPQVSHMAPTNPGIMNGAHLISSELHVNDCSSHLTSGFLQCFKTQSRHNSNN